MVVPSPHRVTRNDWLLACAAALAALLTYANSLPNGFAFDDLPIIEKNHQLRFLSNLPRFFRQDYFEPSMRLGLYRPLVVSSYALNMTVSGDGPLGFHVVNVLLHALNAALLTLLVLRLTRDRWLAAGAGFLFAAHAVHSEAVANVTFGRPELLAACFGLLTLHLWITAGRAAGARAKLAYAASLLCFGLALLSKESAVTVLVVAVLVDWIYTDGGQRQSLRSLGAALRAGAGRSLGLVLVAVAIVGVRVWALGAQAMPPVPFVDNPLGTLPLGWRLVDAALVALRYGGLLLLPLTLCSDYSYDTIPMVQSFGDPVLWLGAALLLLLALFFVWSHRRDREIFFGLAFLAVTFSTASNLLMPIGTILGERLLYLPSAGFCMALTRVVQRAAALIPGPASRRRSLFAAVIAGATLLHGARAVLRNPVWRDQHTLALHDVAIHPRSVKLQTSAGAAYWELGKPELALAHFEAAIAPAGITPDRFLNPFQGRVRALVDLGRWQEALVLYEEVVKYGPRNLEVESQLAAAANAARAEQLETPGP
jgi:hypothetical protein